MSFKELFMSVLFIFPQEVHPKEYSDFNKAVQYVLKHEGGLSTNKYDKGGITNYGISFKFLKSASASEKDLMSEVDLNRNKIVDDYDIRYMTRKEAEKLYKNEFWDKYGYGRIDYQPLATKVFDMAVNMGPQRSAVILRKACLSYNYPKNIKNTPYLKSEEINFINSLDINDKNKILENIINLSIEFYTSLAKKSSSQQKFLKGWLKRAKEPM